MSFIDYIRQFSKPKERVSPIVTPQQEEQYNPEPQKQNFLEQIKSLFDPQTIQWQASPEKIAEDKAKMQRTVDERYNESQKRFAELQPQPTPTPTLAPTPEPTQTGNPYSNMVAEIFGEDAPDFERVLMGENASHNPQAVNKNDNGTEDRGIAQINENTFSDFQRRHPEELKKFEIESYDDMFDPLKNLIMAKMIFDEQGYDAFFGAPDDLKGKR